MTSSAKRSAITFLFITMLITMVLAAGLPRMKLQNGIPLPGSTQSGTQVVGEAEGPNLSIRVSTFMKTVISLFVIMMLIYFAVKLRRKPAWREIAQVLLRMAILALVITGIFFAMANVQVTLVPTEVEVLPVEVKQVGPPLDPVPPSLLWLVWLGLVVLVIGLVIGLLWGRKQPGIAQDPLVLEAEQAVQSIKAGQDLKSVIIHCYRQMSLVLQEEKGVTLTATMTAREFEALLGMRGVPDTPVRQLTRLFEIARYGARTPGADEEQQAIECLSAIIQFSQKKPLALTDLRSNDRRSKKEAVRP